ncbi:MAG: FAD-linked oxidase C-terminal domain-containing protein [Bacillota bacterium]
MPVVRNTMQLMFKSLDDACAVIHNLLQSNVIPASAELMDKMSLQAVAQP